MSGERSAPLLLPALLLVAERKEAERSRPPPLLLPAAGDAGAQSEAGEWPGSGLRGAAPLPAAREACSESMCGTHACALPARCYGRGSTGTREGAKRRGRGGCCVGRRRGWRGPAAK
jgi:hypothetical protein